MKRVCYELRDGGGNSLGYASTHESARKEAIKLVLIHREVRIIRHEEVENVTVDEACEGWMRLSLTQP